MTRQVLFRPEADAEVAEASQWYEQRRSGLGGEFAAAVAEVVSRIVENPLVFPRVHGQTRRAILRRFPYALYFRTLGDDIVVLAVQGRQHPRRWQSRI